VRANVSLTTNALLGFVNSEPVFVQDLFGPIDGDLRSFAKNSHNISEFRTQARGAISREMQAYVQDMVTLATAKASLSDNEKKGLDIYLAKQRSDLLSKYGGSQAQADLALKATGSSVEKEIAKERSVMTVRIYVHRQLYPRIVVTRQMVMDEYERSKHQEDAEIELFTITLRVSRWLREPGADGKLGPVMQNPTDAQVREAERMALKQAADIVGQLRNGADFARLVEDNSQDDRANFGGRMPNVKRGSLKPVLEDAAFALPANTVGAPLLIKDPDFKRETVVILKVGEKKEGRTIPFSEAQAGIYTTLSERAFKELYSEYMGKLMQGATVEAVERMTDVALDVAVARYATQ
jgi:parvulin-like peptidyl-prolyl isomerase